MDWDAIGAIGEIVGAIAVVITIALLVRETRTNTEAVVASAMRASSLSFADFNTRIASDPDLARICRKSFDREMSEWNDLDWFRFQVFARAELDRMGDLFRQARLGFFAEEEADWYLNYFRSLLEYPAWKIFWDDETKSGLHGQAFVDDINSRSPMRGGLSRLAELRQTASSRESRSER